MPKLNDRQKAFVAEYLIDLNATQAAIRAGYSKKTAASQGERLLRNVEIAKLVNKSMAERSERTQIDADWLLTRLATEAEADLSDIYNETTGQLKPIREWPKIWRQGLVAGVKTRQEGIGEDGAAEIVEVKLADRNAKLKMIGDHIGVQAFKKQIDHSHTHKWEELTDEQLNAEIAKRQSGKN